MKLAIIIFVIVLTFLVLLAKFINYSTRLISSEKMGLRQDISAEMLTVYSVGNAITVNTSLSRRNSPVRPADESFYDGILREITKSHDSELPECILMDIRSFVKSNIAEDTNGTL